MANLDFPASPAVNDTYTFNGKVWEWDGTAWNLVPIAPGDPTLSIQYNNAGVFAGSAEYTINVGTAYLYLGSASSWTITPKARTGTNQTGLSLSIVGGTPTGTGTGGAVNITGGAGTSTVGSYGGAINITGGAATASTGKGGAVNITGGATSTNGNAGGGIVISGGASTSHDGGAVQILGGNTTNAAFSGGSIEITGGQSANTGGAVTINGGRSLGNPGPNVSIGGGAGSTGVANGSDAGVVSFTTRAVTAASTTTRAGFNLPHGSAPTSPTNGDIWTTSLGLYVRINGSTVGPLGTGGGGGVTEINGYTGAIGLIGTGGTTVSLLSGNMIEINSSATAGVTSLNGFTGPVSIAAGSNVTVTLQSGNVISIASTGGSGSPGGATTQIQFNDAGAFNGDANLTWDKTNKILALGAGVRLQGDFTNATNTYIQTSVANGLTSVWIVPNGTSTVAAINVIGQSTLSNFPYLGMTIDKTNSIAALDCLRVGTGTPLPFYLRVGTGATVAMSVQTNANINFGTTITDPGVKVQVEGTFKTTGVNTFATTSASTVAGNFTFNGAVGATAGQISLNNGTSNWIDWRAVGVAAPAFTTRSAGTKLILWPGIGAASVDYAIGIENFTLWNSVPDSSSQFKWYYATTEVMRLTSTTLLLPGTGRFIQADWSNATVANRASFQTSTTNGDTLVQVVPNGTGTTSAVTLFGSSSVANASYVNFACTSTETFFSANRTGTGTYLPFTIYTSATRRLYVHANGNINLGSSTTDPSVAFNVEGLSKFASTVGIGTTASTTYNAMTALEVGQAGVIQAATALNRTYLINNLRYLTTTGWTYKNTDYGHVITLFDDGALYVQLAPSGTAGNTATPVSRFIVGNTGVIQFPSISTTASAANAFLDNAASNSLLRSTSSLRFKTNVRDLPAGKASQLLSLRPIVYNSAAGADDPSLDWYGLGAEEVAAIDPRLVHWSYDDRDMVTVEEAAGVTRRPRPGAQRVPDGVMYERLPVLMLPIIKAHEAEIAALKAQIAALQQGRP